MVRFAGAILTHRSAMRTWYFAAWRECDGSRVHGPVRTQWCEAFADLVIRGPLLGVPTRGRP